MILSAHQNAYNPWLGYIHKILLSDTFVVMDDVQFEKNSFINRNKIVQNSNEVMLSIPVETKNYQNKSIKDIKVANSIWRVKHRKSIKQSYSKSIYFESVFDELEKIYSLESHFLIDYTDAYMNFLIKYLNIETKIIYASTLNLKSNKLEYIIEMCKTLHANTFIFGKQGRNYVDKRILEKNSLNSYFQNYQHPTYKQTSNSFIPNLGIIDLLFNEDKSNIKDIILDKNITKEELLCQKGS